jgi:hypothetical protein
MLAHRAVPGGAAANAAGDGGLSRMLRCNINYWTLAKNE